MAGNDTRVDAAPAGEEARLARAAAAGDGSAFATLYERYAQRAYNLAYRIAGSEADAADAVQEAFLNTMRRLPKLADREELAFGSYLFTATRNACYDLMRSRQRTQPSEEIPESATPLGSGAGGLGLDPGDPEEDPDRKVLLSSQQEEIRSANARLPERQREALALRELEELSYDEIAATMGMNRNSVAQLISRARINLRDELRGTALASVAHSSPECERALPLIAMRDDGQLAEDSDDDAWLDAHLAGCDSCRVGMEAMAEAGVSYRAWAPIAVAPGLFRETMAKAAKLVGADWSEEIATREAARRRNPVRRRAAIAAGLAALLIAGVAAVLGDDDPPPPESTEAAPAVSASPSKPGAKTARPKQAKASKEPRGTQTTEEAPAASTAPATGSESAAPAGAPSEEPAGKPKQTGGRTAVRPPRQAASPKPEPESPPPTPPAPEEPPTGTEPPTTEEPPQEPPTEREPPREPPPEPPR